MVRCGDCGDGDGDGELAVLRVLLAELRRAGAFVPHAKFDEEDCAAERRGERRGSGWPGWRWRWWAAGLAVGERIETTGNRKERKNEACRDGCRSERVVMA